MKPYEITFEDFLNAQRLHRGIKPLIRAIVIFLGITYVITGNKLFSDGGLSSLGVEVFACGAVGIVISPFVFRHRLKKIFESHKALRETVTMEFNSETVHSESKPGTWNKEWKDIHGVKLGRNLILLYETKQLMRIIPDRAFSDTQEHDEFLRAANLIANQRVDLTR